MSRPISILHLSDIHFSSAGKNDSADVFDALLSDVGVLTDSGSKPDLILISGDLVDRGDDEHDHLYLFDTLLSPLLERTRCSESRIIICPGNHDAQRESIKANDSTLGEFSANARDSDSANALYRSGKISDYSSKVFERFLDLQKFLGPMPLYSDPLISVYSIDEFEIEVHSINTAFSTWAGLKKETSDRGHLRFPIAAIKDAQRKFSTDKPKLLLGHHPIDWLCEPSSIAMNDVLDGTYIGHLFGHMHDPRPKCVNALKGACFQNQSGSIFYKNGSRFIGYSILQFDLNSGHVQSQIREFHPVRREFALAHSIIDGGKFYSSPQAKSFFYRLSKKVDRAAVATWAKTRVLPRLVTVFDEAMVDRPLSNIFVPPPLFRRVSIDLIAEGGAIPDAPQDEEKPVSIGEIVDASENIILFGSPEYGRTTLLQQLAIRLISDLPEDCVTIPTLINFPEIRAGADRILSLVRAGVGTEAEGFTFRDALDEGLMTILVDDVEFSDRRRLKELDAFVNQFPKCRYIFSSVQDNSDHIGAVPGGISSTTFSHIYLKSFTRKKLRLLLEKWAGPSSADIDEMLTRLIREMQQMNVPITAANGTILLTIFEAEGDFTPINRATLIEQFVETVLEKKSSREVERRSFDYKHKVHVLSLIAEYMVRENRYILAYPDTILLIERHFQSIGIQQDSKQVIDEFIDKRIFVSRADHQISFRYRAYLEFFVALRMQQSADFRGFVLLPENMFSYPNEIQYYAGLVRNDADLLEVVASEFAKVTTDYCKKVGWNPDLAKFNQLAPPLLDEKVDIASSLQRQIDSPPLTPDQRDEALEAEIPADVERRQEVFRPSLHNVGLRWSVGIILYSGVLKNLEIIPVAAKRKHLAEVLFAWGLLTLHSFSMIPELARKRRMRINGIMYEVRMPRHWSEQKVARAISVDMPNSVSRLISLYLGTDKLKAQLVEPALFEAGEPRIVSFYRHALIADLRLHNWLDAVKVFREAISSASLLHESFIKKLTEIYLLGAIAAEKIGQLRTIIAEGIVDIAGVRPSLRGREISKRIVGLERRAQVHHMKITAAEIRDETSAEKKP